MYMPYWLRSFGLQAKATSLDEAFGDGGGHENVSPVTLAKEMLGDISKDDDEDEDESSESDEAGSDEDETEETEEEVEATEDETAEVEAEAEAEAESEDVDFGEWLKEQGIEVEGANAFEQAQALAKQAKAGRDLQAQIDAAKSYVPQAQPQEQQTQRPVSPQLPAHVTAFAAKQAQYEAKMALWSKDRVPAVLDFEHRLKTDDQGNVVPVNPADTEVIPLARQAAAWKQQAGDALLTSFPELVTHHVLSDPVIGASIQQAIEQAAQRIVGGQMAPMQIERKADEIWSQVKGRVYTVDATGVEMVTPYGSAYLNAIQSLRSQGFNHPEQLHSMADDFATRLAASAPKVAPVTEATRANRNLKIMKQASKKTSGKAASAAGSVKKPTPGQKRTRPTPLTLQQEMLAAMKNS